jgi:thiol-disulfide isomerase/thioredoxin
MAAVGLRWQVSAAVSLLTAAPALAAPFPHSSIIRPQASLPAITAGDGTQLTLRAFRGRVVLINFWASWCVACRTELPSLERLAAKRGNLIVIAASVDANRDDGISAFAGRYPHLRLAFSSLPMVQRFGALGMPYSVILDTNGREVARVPRALRWDTAEGAGLLRKR